MRDGEEAAKQGFEVGERQEPTGGRRQDREAAWPDRKGPRRLSAAGSGAAPLYAHLIHKPRRQRLYN